MSDVFVSYKAEDRRRVKPLVEALQATGYSVWWDQQIGGGSSWRRTIESELNAAKCVIVVWSKRSVGPQGTFVQDEADRAQERGVYLPISIDKVHPPLGFGETQAFPLSGWHGDQSSPHYRAVLDAVRSVIAGQSLQKRERPIFAAGVRRRSVIVGGVAAAATAGVASWLLFRPKPLPGSDSIAVLPFANLSGDPRETVFSDGIAEELRDALARQAGLKVVGRISSEAVRGEDVQTAARKLRVANVLTGSVRESPSRIRINAELIDGRTGVDRWAQDYDRTPGDSIMIQTDIAGNVATALAGALGTAGHIAVIVGGTSDAAAQRLLIEARAVAREGTKEARQHALELVESAIRLDGKYAEAYAYKSLMLGSYANNYATAGELANERAEAMRLAQTAIKISPELGIGHAAVAQLFQSSLNMAPAASAFERAVQLAPGNADIVGRYVYLLARLGKPLDALRTADNVIGLDPLNHFSYENRVSALYDLRRYQDALAYAQQVQRQSPELFMAQGLIADCLLMLGRAKEAMQAYGLLVQNSWQQLNGEALTFARAGDPGRARDKLAELERLFGEASSYQYAGIHAQLGDQNAALNALEHAFAIRDSGLVSIKVDPILDPIRKEPRFNEVLKKMNFPS